MEGMTASQMDWCWIGCLDSLQKLDVGQIGWGLIGGILSLTRCRELRLLRLRFESRAYLLPDHFAGKSTQLELKNQVGVGLVDVALCMAAGCCFIGWHTVLGGCHIGSSLHAGVHVLLAQAAALFSNE
jgi:hypothetical protein